MDTLAIWNIPILLNQNSLSTTYIMVFFPESLTIQYILLVHDILSS